MARLLRRWFRPSDDVQLAELWHAPSIKTYVVPYRSYWTATPPPPATR